MRSAYRLCPTRRNILAAAIATEAIGAFPHRPADTITATDFSTLDKAVADWFASKLAKRTHVVPCAILLTTAKPFSVGPILFSHIGDFIKRRTGDLNAELGQLFYEPLLQTLAARFAKWVAEVVREARYEAAASLLLRVKRYSALRAWELCVAKRTSMLCANVAVARKLSGILHRMWIDGTEFQVGFGAKVVEKLRLKPA